MTELPPAELLIPDPNLPTGDRRAQQVFETLQSTLDARDAPKAFSTHGLARLLERQAEFLEELGVESIRIARRAGNYEVQPIDVDRAREILGIDPSHGLHGLEVFSALLWGVAATAFVQELVASKPRMWLVGFSASGVVLATILLMYSLLRTRRRR
jgi:hypothetical protein